MSVTAHLLIAHCFQLMKTVTAHNPLNKILVVVVIHIKDHITAGLNNGQNILRCQNTDVRNSLLQVTHYISGENIRDILFAGVELDCHLSGDTLIYQIVQLYEMLAVIIQPTYTP